MAFDLKYKGFDNNKSQNFTGLMSNCVAFNNNMNYELPYTFVKWAINSGWDSKKENKFDSDINVKKPSNANITKKNIYSVRDQIIKVVYANTFPEDKRS